ncbi:MAG TPA: MBL fold metallo-hydrolase [Longimicrobium sp.]|nr:MBL fold metallo-hydrolase [Longimicrobium sp.]
MDATHRLKLDLANVFDGPGRKAKVLVTLAWGDEVRVTGERGEDGIPVAITRLRDDGERIVIEDVAGFIRPGKRDFGDVLTPIAADDETRRVLRVDFVDVQQGDGAVVETPEGRTMLVDGGQEQLFARYLARRFGGTSDGAPKEIDCIVVTHGDADHFAGLTQIHASEAHGTASKRLFIHPARVYHNGLVKRPSKRNGREVPDVELLGATEMVGKTTVITGLVDDPRAVGQGERNFPFTQWCEALDAWDARGRRLGRPPMELRRLDADSDGDALFRFLDQGAAGGRPPLAVEVLGPIPTPAGGRPGLKFLGSPTPRVGRAPGAPKFKGKSASHTINGHSLILRLRYGNVRFMLSGDLNEEAEEHLTELQAERVRAEVLKVPHHGSADYSAAFLKTVAPVVSVVSSGDENEQAEHIHPRATLVGALGRYSRPEVEEPVVFVTELAAFFAVEGPATVKAAGDRPARDIFAFSRRAFGIVKVRTDGRRLLVYTYSGDAAAKEAYAFLVGDDGRVSAGEVLKC